MVAGAAVVAVPQGYAEQRERGAHVVALPSIIGRVCQAIRERGSLHAWAAAQPGARVFTGRGAAYGVSTADGAWVVRHYRRGGAVARVLGDRYVRSGEPRPLLELRASEAARARGVATPEVVAAVTYAAGAVYRGDLATAYVPDSADLAESVLGAGRLDAAGRTEAWHAAGRLLRDAFAAGIEHADLNLRNILVVRTAAGARALLLDLDRAAVRPRALERGTRDAMLRRLHRSRRKLEGALGRLTSDMELSAFEAGLNADD
jgi:3-deoxy-D-manno-octulosonic acid kinase